MYSLHVVRQKNLLFVFFLLVIFSLIPESSNAQIVIGATSTPNVYLGYDLQKFVILIGGDLRIQSSESEYKGNTESTDIFVIIPYIGGKLFLKRNDLSPYIFANAGKEIPLVTSAKGTYDDEEEEKRLKDQNDDYYSKLGIGLEYFFQSNISIGGEIGLRANYSDYDYSLGSYSSFVMTSCSNLTFNYYF